MWWWIVEHNNGNNDQLLLPSKWVTSQAMSILYNTSIVLARFWVTCCNVCKLHRRGRVMFFKCHSPCYKRASVGAGVLGSVSAWEICKCSPHLHMHPHVFPFFLVLLFLYFCPPPHHHHINTPTSHAERFSLVKQNTFAGDTMSLHSISPCLLLLTGSYSKPTF